jgi:sigma-B regulation protein RsbU (phosphoserine phosphatase)
MAPRPHASDAQPMHCMEIRGGSQAVEETVATPGLEAWLYSQPHEGDPSGGDVHYVSLCGGGVITRLIVADVSGHGRSVAEFSASLRTLVRKNINTKSQTRLVRALNREFALMAQSRRFATAVVATYLATLRRLTVCNAGHPRPLWCRARTATWAILDREDGVGDSGGGEPGNMPLGLDDETRYRQYSHPLERGDVVMFYTDALIEAADPAGRMLGEEGLLGLVRGLDVHEPGRIGPALLARVAGHRGGQPADDDVTLLVLRHNGEGPRRLSLGEKLDVYAKVFGVKSY